MASGNAMEPNSNIISELKGREMSEEDRAADMREIRCRLAVSQAKCIAIDDYLSSVPPMLELFDVETWRRYIDAHYKLLQDSFDFFLAYQHPSTSPALRRLAFEDCLPGRMWWYGIHRFLEALLHRLPASLELMLWFIKLAYSMMTLLLETVPAFEEIWIECLGDIARYRMAIEQEDMSDKDVWRDVSADWYSKKSDVAPEIGRLYHHLGCLFRSDVTRALSFYTKSTCVATPFPRAYQSMIALFEETLGYGRHDYRYHFVQMHCYLLAAYRENDAAKASGHLVNVVTTRDIFLSQLDTGISRQARHWLRPGSEIAVSNCNAILQYGELGNPIFRHLMEVAVNLPSGDQNLTKDDHHFKATCLSEAQALVSCTDEVVFARFGDPNILPYVHVRLAFMVCMVRIPAAAVLCDNFSWHLLTCVLNSTLNSLRRDGEITLKLPNDSNGGQPRREEPLPEDWTLRGLLWTRQLFPADHFDESDQDERKLEMERPSRTNVRKRRLIDLGNGLAAQGKWFTYNREMDQFVVSPAYEKTSVTELFVAYKDKALAI